MKRIACLAFVVLLVGLVFTIRPTEGQDNLQDRVSALETQVAELQELVGAGAPAATTGPTHTLHGSITLYGDRTGSFPSINSLAGGGCEGDGGYSDFNAGGNITIKDGDGAIIASGMLEPGKIIGGGCRMPFTIDGVPEVPFYSVEIGRRGGYSVSLAEMQASRWTLDLSIGP